MKRSRSLFSRTPRRCRTVAVWLHGLTGRHTGTDDASCRLYTANFTDRKRNNERSSTTCESANVPRSWWCRWGRGCAHRWWRRRADPVWRGERDHDRHRVETQPELGIPPRAEGAHPGVLERFPPTRGEQDFCFGVGCDRRKAFTVLPRTAVFHPDLRGGCCRTLDPFHGWRHVRGHAMCWCARDHGPSRIGMRNHSHHADPGHSHHERTVEFNGRGEQYRASKGTGRQPSNDGQFLAGLRSNWARSLGAWCARYRGRLPPR